MRVAVISLFLVSLHQPAGWQARAAQEPQQQPRPGTVESRKDSQQWRAATFQGLVVGRATLRDVRRVLGEPSRSELMGERPSKQEVWYHYKADGDLPGELVVVTAKRNGLVLRIDLYPRNLLAEQAIKHFGPGYVKTRYDFDDCLGDGESAPVYESADGAITNIEYRERGIAITVNYRNEVDHINYVSKPIGAPFSRCKRG